MAEIGLTTCQLHKLLTLRVLVCQIGAFDFSVGPKGNLENRYKVLRK
tara:strand:+ start:57 stop:197 length:141 start_codon:yes stop_codon:yes gene_type:complete